MFYDTLIHHICWIYSFFTTYLYNARWALVLLPVYSIAYILFINFEKLVGYRVIMAMLFAIGFVIKYLTSHKKKDLCRYE